MRVQDALLWGQPCVEIPAPSAEEGVLPRSRRNGEIWRVSCSYGGNTWEAAENAVLNVYSIGRAYRKVLKHRPLRMFQIRTVSRSTRRGSLGKEMGKLLGYPGPITSVAAERSGFRSPHLIYSAETGLCDMKPCRSFREKGVFLA